MEHKIHPLAEVTQQVLDSLEAQITSMQTLHAALQKAQQEYDNEFRKNEEPEIKEGLQGDPDMDKVSADRAKARAEEALDEPLHPEEEEEDDDDSSED